MSETALNPEEIPEFTGNLEQLEKDASAIVSDGTSIADAASKVDSTFQGLSSYYAAPEADRLFASTALVATAGGVFEDDLATIGAALSAYATEIRPIVDRFKQLRAEAEAFRTSIADDDKWREDGDLVEENNARREAVNQAFADFQAAERTCHNKIVALVGGTPLKVTDGSKDKNQYGFRAEDLNGAKDLPWGDPVEESTPWYHIHEHAWDFGKGLVVDGVWGTIKGLGTLVGFDGWDAMKQAWTGLAKLATGIVITASPFGAAFWLAPEDKLPSWIRDSRTAMKETGKALVAWDQWGSNPARAAGATTFNVLTTVFTAGAGAGVSGAGKAGAISKAISAAGKAGRIVDPMTYIFKAGAYTGVKIGDVLATLRGAGRVELPPLPANAVQLPDGARLLDDGTFRLPEGAPVPRGAVELGDGRISVPDEVPAVPGDAVPVPLADGAQGFLLRNGDIVDGRLNVISRVDEAPLDIVDTPAAAAARAEQPVLVGARVDDVVSGSGGRADDGLGPVGRADDGLGPRMDLEPAGGGRGAGPAAGAADGAAAGGARDLGGSGDDLARGSGGGPEPAGGGRGSGPGGGGLGGSLDGLGGDGPHPAGAGGDAAGSGDNAAGAGDDGVRGGADGGVPGRPSPLERPEFMRDGSNPYGEPGSLTRRQIEDIQVYRANTEPGYFEDHYRSNGTRKDLGIHDESGYAPPQLVQLTDGGPWVRAHDVPAPPKPHYLDESYLRSGADSAAGKAKLKILDAAAKARHLAVQWGNMMADWKASSAAHHEAVGTHESAGLAGEARGSYKEAHTQMAQKSEDFGETVAEHGYMAEHHPDFVKQELDGPANGNDQFDQVWKHDDGRVVVIEAKGSPDADLGSRRLPNGQRVSQGSREYFMDILRAMRKRGEISLARDLKAALDSGKLEYVAVRGERNSGTYTGYQYRRFDISKGTLP
ncbi:hypothetical protein [Streptomyces indicus]|uniref:Uncharacterized protein n=1 Tax=Streptomyces indicus TaxID=417292 RepID=A0A1G9G1Q3_9ACTN|nr:hypothetical protein [Streptomyces indicus]SDK94566.1 hypothetical protein SAMN05421806_114192 [Streptomyces indicus]